MSERRQYDAWISCFLYIRSIMKHQFSCPKASTQSCLMCPVDVTDDNMMHDSKSGIAIWDFRSLQKNLILCLTGVYRLPCHDGRGTGLTDVWLLCGGEGKRNRSSISQMIEEMKTGTSPGKVKDRIRWIINLVSKSADKSLSLSLSFFPLWNSQSSCCACVTWDSRSWIEIQVKVLRDG